MNKTYNIYCDESCHLQNDGINVMVLGAIWCPMEKRKEFFTQIREIKEKHGLSKTFEIKWNKVSSSKIDFYLNLIDYFYENSDIYFRVLVVPEKDQLNHDLFNQTHDEFYYKMYFDLLKVIFAPDDAYNIYIDIKDTKSQDKVDKLANVLRNNRYDYVEKVIKKVQQVDSKEVELLQLADLLIGAVGYVNRGLTSSESKLKIIERIQDFSGYTLMRTTLLRENKTNIFIWKSSQGGSNA